MIRLRRFVQILSLLFFLFLLIITALPGAVLLRVTDLYPRMSPLMLFSNWLNTWKFPIAFIPAIALLALTVLLGRFFCGWICPLGVTLDATDRALTGRARRDDSKEPLRWKAVKYGILILVLVAAYFEAGVAGWLDPLSFATRLYSLALLPAAEFVARLTFEGLRPVPVVGGFMEQVYSVIRAGLFAADQPGYAGMAAVLLLFAAMALLVFFNRRFWCRFLCPAGAIFALVSRKSAYRRVVSADTCIQCNKCVRTCRMGAIRDGGRDGWAGECIECRTCESVCPVDAVKFRFSGARADADPVSLDRRGVLASLGAAAVAVPLARLNPGSADTAIIRPPGVLDENLFQQTCLHCGACMRACPTNGLQPVWFEHNLESLWTPKLAARKGNCDYTCTKCGQICPSGAITELELETKKRTVIGRAVFDHNRCIPWSRNENCAVCEEHCPVPEKAIRMRKDFALNDAGKRVSVMRPYVVEDLCIGCGVCETVCPVEGASGVRVTGVPQFTRPNAKKKNASKTTDPLITLLPPDPAPWKPEDKPHVVVGEKLFDLINGGAEVYHEYGFNKALRQNYLDKDENFLTVEIYLMADLVAAYGIFSAERTGEEKPADIGDAAVVSEYEIKFQQREYFVKIMGDADEAEYTRLAKIIEKRIGKKSGEIEQIKWRVPGHEDAAPGSELILRGPLAMRRVFVFSSDDIFNFKKGTVGLAYTMKAADEGETTETKCAVIQLPGKTNAVQALESAQKSLLDKGFKQKENAYTMTEEDVTQTIVIAARDAFVDIVITRTE